MTQSIDSTMPLTPTQRRALKARAHHLDPVVMIGDAGLTPAVLNEADLALKAHELIKIRVFGDDRDARLAHLARLCEELHCTAIQHIGKLLVLYRQRAAETPRTHVPKKKLATGGKVSKKGAKTLAVKPGRKTAAPKPSPRAAQLSSLRKAAGSGPAGADKSRSPATRRGGTGRSR